MDCEHIIPINLAFSARFWWPLFWLSYFGRLGSHKGFGPPVEYSVVWCLQEELRLVGRNNTCFLVPSYSRSPENAA